MHSIPLPMSLISYKKSRFLPGFPMFSRQTNLGPEKETTIYFLIAVGADFDSKKSWYSSSKILIFSTMLKWIM
jgi:hypothetical protein